VPRHPEDGESHSTFRPVPDGLAWAWIRGALVPGDFEAYPVVNVELPGGLSSW